MLAQHAFAWLLTYLLHSTLLLGLAWLASKPLARWSVSAEEAVWKIALIGALLTASLQFAAGWEPAAGRLRLAQTPTIPSAAVEAMAAPVAREAVPPAAPFRFAPSTVPAAPAPKAIRATPAPALSFRPSVPGMILGLWALGAAVLLGTYGRSYLKVQRRLRTRPRVVGGHVLNQLRDLSIEAGLDRPVRLSCSSRVPVPLALGLREPEICLPPRALAGLTEEQQEGMLAHELAHLVRRDPVWLVISHVLAGIFFFQPLNWVARRRLREISEILSDEWAVGFTGRPLSLAGCLAEVAGWSVGIRPLPLPGMADRPSNLAKRIRRLLDETRSPEHPARRVWLGAAMVALLIVVVAAAPAISAARPQQPAAPKTAQAPAHSRAAEAAADAADEDDDSWLDARPEHDKPELAELAEMDGADDPGVDVDIDHEDLDAMVDGAMSSMDEALDGMGDQLASLEDAGLTPEQQRKLEADIERSTRKIQETLQPRMEELSREMSRKMARLHETDGEMQRLQQEMAKLAAQMRPSDAELDRIRAEAEKLREEGDGALTREQRDQLRQEARRLAEAARPSKGQLEQMKALRLDLQRRSKEMSRELREEHRAEIEKAQAEMRDEIEREMGAMRQELKRSMEERHQIERQERKERRERLERDRDRDRGNHDRDRDHKRDKEESVKEKPPKMVLQLDMWGNFRLVPETPGC